MGPTAKTALYSLRHCIATVALTACIYSPAHAQTSNQPMTFEWGEVFGLHRVIFANGDLTPETPAALSAFLDRTEVQPATNIYLNSNAGDLGAGMQLGQVIRRAQLHTSVGRNGQNQTAQAAIDTKAPTSHLPGQCISACTLAFLGGVSREVDSHSVYAVHQVSMDCVDKSSTRNTFPWLPLPNINYCPDLDDALSLVQVASGAVVEYVRSMGADPIFLTEMSRAGPNSVNALTTDELAAYNITHSPKTITWSFETNEQGEFFLRHTQADPWKEHLVELYCRKDDSKGVAMWLAHDTRRNRGRANTTIITNDRVGLYAEWSSPAAKPQTGALTPALFNVQRLQVADIAEPLSTTEFENITVTFNLNDKLMDELTQAETFSIVVRSETNPDAAPFELISFVPDHEKLSGLMRSCRRR